MLTQVLQPASLHLPPLSAPRGALSDLGLQAISSSHAQELEATGRASSMPPPPGPCSASPVLSLSLTLDSSCRAAELPQDLLALVLGHLLQAQADGGEPAGPFRQHTPLLRTALNLAVVCRAWRQAMLRAMELQRGALVLHPAPECAPESLSGLLGKVAAGCGEVQLDGTLLTSSTVPRFLEAARPRLLTASAATDAGLVGASLGLCGYVRSLKYCAGVLPPSWPPNLQELELRLAHSALAADLQQSLGEASQLHTLTVDYPSGHATLPALPTLIGLRLVTMRCWCTNYTAVYNFSGLEAAALQGARVAVCVRLYAPSQSKWQRSYTCVLLLPHLDQLQLRVGTSLRGDLLVFKPQQPLRCRQLVLFAGHQQTLEYLLRAVRCETCFCHLKIDGTSVTGALQCTALAAQPGLYVLDSDAPLTVLGCAGQQPAFTEGWALVVTKQWAQGLSPDWFSAGPRGHPVWRNSAVSDADLDDFYQTIF